MRKYVSKSFVFVVIALVAVFAALLFVQNAKDTVAVQQAKEAYAQYVRENPSSKESDFIYIYDEHIIIAIRDGKVMKKEYVSEAYAVKAATGKSKVTDYSLSSTNNNKLYVVKLFDKLSDVYAVGAQTLAAGANTLTIKVVSNGTIFANFEIPAAAIAEKNSPVEVTISKIDPKDNVKLGANEEGFAYDIDVTNLVENNTSLIKVSMNGPKGLVGGKNEAITVYHNSTPINSTYEAKTGEVSFNTTDFSPYTFVYEMITVNSVEELRFQLQREASGNIRLGQNIFVDMEKKVDAEGKVTNPGRESEGEGTFVNKDGYKVYYARAPYGDTWQYFGALVIGDMTLDLNGFEITYNGDSTKNDSALFAVGNNSSLTIVDSSHTSENPGTGRIEVPYNQYAIWSVDYTSAVSIYDGIFATDFYVDSSVTQADKALLYSTGGKINVFGGYYMYTANGGFNVLNSIKEPRIWLHQGVKLSNQNYRDNNDIDSIVLVGDAALSAPDAAGWCTVQGQKLDVNVPYTKTMLYRVGNKNSFTLGVFFKELAGGLKGDVDIEIIDIIATDKAIEKLKNESNDKFNKENGYYKDIASVPLSGNGVDYKYTANATWTAGTIQFNGFTGPVRLDLIDKGTGAVCASINLEVVDGYNVYDGGKLYHATSTNKNVCLLSDLTLSSKNAIQVTGGYALYGNGFTIYDKRLDSATGTDNTKDKNGIVSVSDGVVENVQIIGYQLTTPAKISSGNTGHAPAVFVSGNTKIYNSYIYGGSSPIMSGAGTVVLDNVTLDGGGFCNMYVWGATNLTLKDCTTTTDTTGVGAVALGIVVSNSNAKIKLEGTLKQHNWLTIDQMDVSISGINAKKIVTPFYNGAVDGVTYYYENKDGVRYVNTGLFFVDAESAGATPFTTTLVKDMMDVTMFSGEYVWCQQDVTEMGVTVTATGYFPLPSVSVDMLGKPSAYTPDRYHAYKPTFSYNNTNTNLTGTGMDSCKYENGAINIETKADTVTLDLSGISLGQHGLTGSYAWTISPAAISTSGKKVTLSTANTSYTVTVRVAVSGCTPSGVRDDSVFEVYTYTLPINIIKNLNPAPEWVGLSTTSTNTGSGNVWLVTNYGSGDPDYAEAVLVYNGIKVKVFNSSNPDDFTTVDLSGRTDIPTVSSDNKTATVFFDGIGTLTISANYSSYSFQVCNNKLYLYHSAYNRNNREDNPTVTLTYLFTDLNGQSTEASVKVSCSFSKSNPGVYIKLDKFKEGKYETCSGEACVTPDTLITLADGTQVRVDSLKGDELLLVWNMKTGKYEAAPIVFVDSDAEEEFEIIHLYFSDGSDVKVISEHGFFDLDLGKYVYIDAYNYADYVGHRFVTEGDIGENTWNVVTLDKVVLETEVTTAWSPVTFEHLCYYTNGVLSMPGGIDGLFNIFEVDTESMIYDAQQMQKDIETYGLFTFEDFDGMIPEMAFDAFNGAYLKVAIGKGLLTWEDIAALAERYVPLM